jgi:hypothetical protein
MSRTEEHTGPAPRRSAVYAHVCRALQRWDPIGVYQGESDWPEGEYDGYAPLIVRRLDAGTDAEELCEEMLRLAGREMNISANAQRTRRVAVDLVEFWRSMR